MINRQRVTAISNLTGLGLLRRRHSRRHRQGFRSPPPTGPATSVYKVTTGALPIWIWPPSWIFHFRFGGNYSQWFRWIAEPRKHRFTRWNRIPLRTLMHSCRAWWAGTSGDIYDRCDRTERDDGQRWYERGSYRSSWLLDGYVVIATWSNDLMPRILLREPVTACADWNCLHGAIEPWSFFGRKSPPTSNCRSSLNTLMTLGTWRLEN